MFAGIAAHSMLPLDRALTAGVGLTLGAMCHVAGWPMPRGGAQAITDALVAHLRTLGGEVVDRHRAVRNLDALPPAKIVLCDLSPRPFLEDRRASVSRRPIAACSKPTGTAWRVQGGLGAVGANPMERAPSAARQARCIWAARSRKSPTRSRRAWEGQTASTVRSCCSANRPCSIQHARQQASTWRGRTATCRTVRRRTCWRRIEGQIERFAPGFRECVLARSVMTPADLEARNANYVGGDIASGVTDLDQFFTRPTWRTYSTPLEGRVSLLGVDAAWRRRPRDGRLPRRAAGARETSDRDEYPTRVV